MSTARRPKLSKNQRRLLDALPWVRVLKQPKKCVGWKAGKGHGARKNTAWFRYTALPRRRDDFMRATTGNYCWSHLTHRCIMDPPDEYARYLDRLYEVGYLCPSVSPSGARCWRNATAHVDHYTAPYTEPYGPQPDLVQHNERWHDDSTSHLKLVAS